MYKEKERSIPILHSADVVVCGGGTAGAVSAIAAAKEGKDVLLIEQLGALGGTSTFALVTPIMHGGIDGNPMCSYISDEINRRTIAYGFAAQWGENPGYFDPIGLKFVLEEMAVEAGVRLLYHTVIVGVIKEGTRISGLIIENKSGRSVVNGSVFIDATGDGDVSVQAGADFLKGDEVNGKNQPISLRYMLGGVNINEFWNQVVSGQVQEGSSRDGEVLHTAVTSNRRWALSDVFDRAYENGDLTKDDLAYWQVFGIPGRRDGLAFNCPEIFDKTDGTSAEHLTNAQIVGKRAIFRQLNFYKKYLSGFKHAYISEISVMVGIRESRRIVTEHILTAKELYTHKKFADAICQSNYPVDIHGADLNLQEIESDLQDARPYYEIPYRALIVKGFDNLLVAGRCIGSDFIAQSSLRVQHSVRAIGEAAGIAAAWALDTAGVRDVDGSKIRKHMQDKGAAFCV